MFRVQVLSTKKATGSSWRGGSPKSPKAHQLPPSGSAKCREQLRHSRGTRAELQPSRLTQSPGKHPPPPLQRPHFPFYCHFLVQSPPLRPQWQSAGN